MKEFTDYLINLNYKQSTISRMLETLGNFFHWKKSRKIRRPTYQHILDYLNEKKIKPGVKRNMANHIKAYFNFETHAGKCKDNPATHITIKVRPGNVRRPYKEEELEQLLNTFASLEARKEDQRHEKARLRLLCFLGFIIYQGLTNKELERLIAKDVDLKKCQITVPGLERKNSRILKLEAIQMMPLVSVLKEMKEEERFIITTAVYRVQQIVRIFKRAGHTVNLQHVRESRFILWLRKYNIREVQYLTGMKHLSSIERYKNKDTEGLKEKVLEYHPFG